MDTYENGLVLKIMDPAFKRIAGMTLVLVLVTLSVLYVFDNRLGEEEVRSQIDDIDYIITDKSDSGINITIRFGITIENYGILREKVIPCSSIQSYLKVKNSTSSLVEYQGGDFLPDTSYIMNSTYISSSCDGQATKYRISENVINNIVVAVPFHFISGDYAFIWEHSFADAYDAAMIKIDLSLDNPVNTVLEAPYEE